ncbi:carboxynorspermidine decarboxylase [Oribacterium sp. WCC10]|uniref:carboxynorspermidine decarboxylase n=1 Tax=Oribacterium sp. WCC10 TaxID=1855343 RepID=UPI0008F00417|nr:carboxynorspermidine decarboxylase [Oribacterium sp. WCC10]SFG23750.1 carboxynorspermidine decarboxylase [Oribacterium sp. WCC10]
MKAIELKTPVYLVDEKKIEENLKTLHDIEDTTGCHILLAQKAFSMYRLYPLISSYISGATASGLFEARLAHEEMQGENHVFSPAFTEDEMKELVNICDHISFNSLRQLELHRNIWESSGVSVGIRINPEFSTQDGHEIYDPCAPGSRLGVRKADMPEHLPSGVEGIHFHTLCEQGAEPLSETVASVERNFGTYLHEAGWINLGGGHHITKPGYNISLLKDIIRHLKETYDLKVYLEPGEAIALDAGYMYTKVLDIVDNTLPVLILDASAACHMPDVLEMPYRPPLRGAGLPGEKSVTCRLASRTCLAGDVIGDYSFDIMPEIGDTLIFEDMAIYSMVKNNTFNGMPLPDIALLHPTGECEIVKSFGYHDFKTRLS